MTRFHRLKWFGLLIFLLLVPPSLIWPWSIFAYPLNVLVASATISLWFVLASPAVKRRYFIYASLFVVLIGWLWISSIRQPITFSGDRYAICISDGCLQVERFMGRVPQDPVRFFSKTFNYRDLSFFPGAKLPARHFWFDFLRTLSLPRPPQVTYFPENGMDWRLFHWELPFWVMETLACAPWAVLMAARFRKPLRPHACRQCGYDLRGCVGELCSECGTPIQSNS